MTHHILEKIEEVRTELQQVSDQFNQLTEQRNLAQQRFIELNGALKTLQELEETEDAREDK